MGLTEEKKNKLIIAATFLAAIILIRLIIIETYPVWAKLLMGVAIFWLGIFHSVFLSKVFRNVCPY